MQYGLQMYSVRDITDKDLHRALLEVGKMGYAFAEFAGFFGHSAQEVRAWLDEAGMDVSGTHTGWQELTPEHFADTVRYHKEIGNRNIIIPGADLSSAEKLNDFIDLLNDVGPKLKKEGITLGYHNHAHEFQKTSYGAFIHHELETRTKVEFEIDTYWAFVAGEDPVGTIQRLADRIRVIHLKDGYKDGHGKALGEGEAPVAAVRKAALDLGFSIVVESETMDPDGLSEVERCITYLKALDLLDRR